MKKKLIYILLILAFSLGVLSIYLFILGYTEGIIAFSIYYIIVFIFQYIKDKSFLRTLWNGLMGFILFPFYPLVMLLQYRNVKPLYAPIGFEDEKLVDITKADFSSVDLAPFNIVLKYGDPKERKYVVRLVYNSIKEEKIDFIDGINLIRSAIKEDSHPDVVLYASDALTNLENYLINKVSYYMDNLNALEDYINYAKYIYIYANSGFLAGEHKMEILWQSYLILRVSIEVFPESPRLIINMLKIVESLEEYEEVENILNEKLENFKAQDLYEYAILFYIKRKEPKVVQQLVSEYINLGFSAKKEAIKFLLGD
ncbi:MAG: hypothetical protein B6I29_02315 [Marinitoga sp. 4572_148]|nr:MAG: hypothetical protein B6I29_02315 [Marinitoga sp. 4572_148]